jgi:hypothetical protein
MKKNGNPQKGIFILFLFYSVASFLSFAISINSFSNTVLKNISLFQHTKKAFLSRCFTGMTYGRRFILLPDIHRGRLPFRKAVSAGAVGFLYPCIPER